MERLPKELIIEILLRLPVKLLLQLRCVSKSFCNLIDTPNFISEHLKRSMDTRTNRLLILQERNINNSPGYYHPEDICFMNFDDGLQEPEVLNNPYPSKRNTTIWGSCNGLLLLLVYEEESIVLWNPSTRRCKKLPICPIHCGSRLEGDKFGLGYDSVSDDYKVVRISLYPKLNQVWVFSLRSSSWRRIQDLPYVEYTIAYAIGGGCFANDALHWLLFGRDNKYIISSFNLATEMFCTIPQPVKNSENSTPHWGGLNVFEGSLCISLTTNDPTGVEQLELEQFELYVRENHGNGFTWSKLYTSQGQLPEEMQPLADLEEGDKSYEFGFTWSSFAYGISGAYPKKLKALAYSTKGNKVLLHDTNDMKIVWYDLYEKKGEMVPNDGVYWEHFDPIVCWESLVSLGDDSKFDGALHWDDSEFDGAPYGDDGYFDRALNQDDNEFGGGPRWDYSDKFDVSVR